MKVFDQLHQWCVYERRVRVLTKALAELIPARATVLDVGCGDGLLSGSIQQLRPDIQVTGIDVFLRPRRHIPVTQFDGERIPFADASFDWVLFVDVLHHATAPFPLLREAIRVARHGLLIKDHTRDGFLAGQTLQFMDWVGNVRHSIARTGNFWPESQWRSIFKEMNLTIAFWTKDVRLYPFWASWLFGRSLHMLVKVVPEPAASAVPSANNPAPAAVSASHCPSPVAG